jgi:hypothetical protein
MVTVNDPIIVAIALEKYWATTAENYRQIGHDLGNNRYRTMTLPSVPVTSVEEVTYHPRIRECLGEQWVRNDDTPVGAGNIGGRSYIPPADLRMPWGTMGTER